MASSKARSRNTAARRARAAAAAGSRSAARTASTQTPRPEQAQAAEQPAAPKAPNGQRQPQRGPGRDPGPSRVKRQQAAADEALTAEPDAVRPAGPPLWLQLVTFVLAIAGLGVSSYETWAHFNGSHLFACAGTGSENCTAVITSPQSMVFGAIPVAILGLLFYVFAVAIMSPWAWRIRRREVGQLRLASVVAGMGFVMYLIYAELYQIGSWCLYCTFVHIITFLLFCVTAVAAALWGVGKPGAPARSSRTLRVLSSHHLSRRILPRGIV